MSTSLLAERVEPTLLSWLRAEFPKVNFATRNPDTSKTTVLIIVDYLSKSTPITQSVNIRLTVYKTDSDLGVFDMDGAYKLMTNVQRFLISRGTTSPFVDCDLFTGVTRIMDGQTKTECLYSVLQAQLVAR